MQFFNLSDIGSVASIVGLVITIFTFAVLWHIKKKFLFNANVECHKKVISQKASEMILLLGDYENNVGEIDELLALVDVELRAVQRGANGDLKDDVRKSRGKINSYLEKPFFRNQNKLKNETKAREIKTSLTVITAEFSHVKRNLLVGK